ncbi:MAG: hypothetical protein WDW38_002064 [Sanguina aurantia]
MGKSSDITGTPKATFTLKSVGGEGFASAQNASGGSVNTLKIKRGPVLLSLVLATPVSDKLVSDLKSLKECTLAMDYTVPKSKKVVLTSKLMLDSKLYTVGFTYTGTLSNKEVGFKTAYASKDKKCGSEAFACLDKNNKTTVNLSNERVVSAKHAMTSGSLTYEPSYNFVKQAPAFAITQKQGKATYKAAYDLKAEKASLEYVQKPYKFTAESKLVSGKPQPVTLAAIFEQIYEF